MANSALDESHDVSDRPAMAREPRAKSRAGAEQDEVIVALAEASRRYDDLAARYDRLMELVVVLGAELYCLQVGLSVRTTGVFGARGLRFNGGASIGTFTTIAERLRTYLHHGGTLD